MTTVTEGDLKRLEDLISDGFNKIDQRFDKIDQEIKELKQGQEKLRNDMIEVKAKLSLIEPSMQKLPDLAEKIGELKNWNKFGLGLIGVVIGFIINHFLNSP